jgi:ABC-type transport system involved in multi-copper enzyme maturation permease subunit
MIALARKELRQFALVLVLPVLWIVLRVQDDDLGERFLAPSETWQTLGVLLPAAFLAACFGLVQFVREEQTRTLSYLVHRELGAARLLAGKASAGILLVAVLAFAPPLGSYGAALALSRSSPSPAPRCPPTRPACSRRVCAAARARAGWSRSAARRACSRSASAR